MLHFSQCTLDAESGMSGMLCLSGQKCKTSTVAPIMSAVRFWEVAWFT